MSCKTQKHTVRYGDEQAAYSVIRNPKRKQRVKIKVRPDGTVEVEAPAAASYEEIVRAVQKRANWIFPRIAAAQKRFEQVSPREYVSGEQVLYLGRRYCLKVQKGARSERSVKLKGAYLQVTTDDKSREAVRRMVQSWYRQRAHIYFVGRAKDLARRLPWRVEPPSIRLREMTRSWGSCAEDGAITLHPALVKAPRECIDYVMLHELCHLREHNHGPAFYRLVNRAMPHWEQTKARLDQMAEFVMNS
jgi:hypothetical protein